MRYLFLQFSAFALILFFSLHETEGSSKGDFEGFPKLRQDMAKELLFDTDLSLEQLRLVRIAKKYSEMKFVPYVWGGGRTGPRKYCYQCSECIKKNRVQVSKRLDSCDACKKCGIDCSHLVNRIYRESGLSYPYATTRELTRLRSDRVLEYYDLFDIGLDVASAMPGDLLLFKKHIGIITNIHEDNLVDFVHVTRFGDRYQHGGIRYEKRRNPSKFRGGHVKILRHKDLVESSSRSKVAVSESRPFNVN